MFPLRISVSLPFIVSSNAELSKSLAAWAASVELDLNEATSLITLPSANLREEFVETSNLGVGFVGFACGAAILLPCAQATTVRITSTCKVCTNEIGLVILNSPFGELVQCGGHLIM